MVEAYEDERCIREQEMGEKFAKDVAAIIDSNQRV